MSDILVKRLRGFHLGLLGEILDEAADEIERLKADVDFHLNTIGRLTTETQRQQDEIERLQAALNQQKSGT